MNLMDSAVKLDIDERITPTEMARRVDQLSSILGMYFYPAKIARTHKGMHFYFYPSKVLNDFETICVQLILGSDANRETFNLRRVRRGNSNWNVLFFRKYDHKGKVISEEKDDLRFTRAFIKAILKFQRMRK